MEELTLEVSISGMGKLSLTLHLKGWWWWRIPRCTRHNKRITDNRDIDGIRRRSRRTMRLKVKERRSIYILFVI